MAADVYKLLQQANWEEIGQQLAGHAAFRAKNLAWRTGDHWDLAEGLNPIDIAQEAIKRLFDGRRTWDPERVALLPFLKGVVDSLISHLVESSDNELQDTIPQGDEDDDLWDRSEFRAPFNDSHDLRDSLAVQPRTPEEALLESEAEPRISKLFEAVQGEADLEKVVHAIMDVGHKPADIAEHLGVPVHEVNNRLKRLRRIAMNSTGEVVADPIQKE